MHNIRRKRRWYLHVRITSNSSHFDRTTKSTGKKVRCQNFLTSQFHYITMTIVSFSIHWIIQSAIKLTIWSRDNRKVTLWQASTLDGHRWLQNSAFFVMDNIWASCFQACCHHSGAGSQARWQIRWSRNNVDHFQLVLPTFRLVFDEFKWIFDGVVSENTIPCRPLRKNWEMTWSERDG